MINFKKQVLKKLPSDQAKEAFADMKQSTDTTWVLASETGEVLAKKT